MKSAARLFLSLALIALFVAFSADAAPRLVPKTIAESKPGLYKVEVTVVQYATPTAAQARINAVLMKEARDSVSEFVKAAKSDNASRRTEWTLDLETQVIYQSDRWLSIQVMGGEFTGGAHPNPSAASHLFDVTNGRELKLSQLFRQGAPYLESLADKCRRELAKNEDLTADKKWMLQGSAPKPENYSVFSIDGKNLVILFRAYQVGPYSSGSPEVKIPFATLKSIAAPSGPLVTP